MANITVGGVTYELPDESMAGKTTLYTAALQALASLLGDGAVWTAWTPTITSGTGTITTLGTVVAKYIKIGKLVVFRLKIPITTNGTAATYIKATLPVTPIASTDFAFNGRETGLTSKSLSVYYSSSLSGIVIQLYDATYPGGTGAVLLISGSYEAA